MGYARKTDANHADIRSALRSVGWVVVDTSALPAFVDLVALKQQRVEFIEVKDRKGKLTPAQVVLHRAFAAAGVTIKILRNVEDAIRL